MFESGCLISHVAADLGLSPETWKLDGAPERLTLDVDATFDHRALGGERGRELKGGYGFHPLQVYLDETRETLGGLLRPGNACSNTAGDPKTVPGLAQIPDEHVESLEILVRADTAGATHARAPRLLPRGEHAVLGRLRADRTHRR